MQFFQANSLVELKQQLAPFGDAFLFRGQTRAYNAPDGSPVLNSTINRMGCIPPHMLKWSFYANELLRRGGFDVRRHDALHFNQGLLQHYGWRSFFVDLSASSAVAAWFAGHSFVSKRGWQFCENSFEEPAMLGVQQTRYNDHAGAGHLYVLNKELLKENRHNLVSLVDDLTTDCLTRFQAQRAWLASIFLDQRRLEPVAVAAQITAPAEVFRELAVVAGFNATDDLFPGPDKDKMLQNLLSLPRMKIPLHDPPFPFYLRSLEIPEYQDTFVKHLPITTTLASSLWLSDVTENADRELWLRVPEDTFYGHTEMGKPMPRLSAYFRSNAVTNIETDGLICYPAQEGFSTYEKGISVRQATNGRLEVCGISIDYASDRVSGGGVARGYMYKLTDDCLVRSPTDTDCPCGDPDRHLLHLQALAILEEMLATAKVERKAHVVTIV
jgi:hypothetical protein